MRLGGLLSLVVVVACSSSAAPRSSTKKQTDLASWSSIVTPIAPRLPAPRGLRSIEAMGDPLPVRFHADGTLAATWPAWRAAIERGGVAVVMLEEGSSAVTAHLDGQGTARGYVSLADTGTGVAGALGWVPAPRPIALSTACEVPPAREVSVAVRSREANPEHDRREGSEQTRTFRTRRMLDVDADGRLDVVVPIVDPNDCPHEVEYAIYAMRGACGHLVGRTLGAPQMTGVARPGELHELRTERRWAELTDARRPPGPHNVATLHEVTTSYRARGQTYRAGAPSVRSGICHHCAMSTCRVIAP